MTTEKNVFVARERELAQLNAVLDRALAAQGQVCFVTGETGSGKTALVTEFARRAEKVHPDLIVVLGNCSAQAGIGDPYLPFREILALLTGDVEAKMSKRTISPENADRLRVLLRWSGNALLEVAPDLINVLIPGVSLITRAGAFVAGEVGWPKKLKKLLRRKAPLAGSPSLEQSRIFEQYTDLMRTLAVKQPLILALDDLQWADTSSISLLFHLSRRLGDSRILLVGTYRPDEVSIGRAGQRHPLEPVLNELKRYYGDMRVDLDSTAEAEDRQFVNAFLDTEPNRLGEDFRQALFRHTGGHPLFTVELLRDMRERRDLVQDEEGRWIEGPALDWDGLPARVEGVIEERIGRLEKELQETLSVASVEGEAFTAEVVARVQAVDERRLSQRLSRELDKQHHLVGAQGVRHLGQQRLSLYRFLHNLLQKYLYNNLDEVERSYLHEDIGNVLEKLYGDQAEEIAMQLARHFQEAGITEKAVHYLRLAGEKATQLSAYEEAIALLTKGLGLLQTLPESSERAGQEIQLNIALGTPLALAKGFAAPEVAEAYARARELCQQVEATPHLFPVLFGLFRFYHVRVELQTAHELGEQLLNLAQRAGDPTFLLQAHMALALTSYSLGELTSARAHFEQGLALYDPKQQRSYPALFGHDPAVASHSFLAQVLWSLGYPDQSLTESRKALALAEELAQPFNQAWALCFAAMIHQYRREVQEARDRAEAAMALCVKYEFPQWLAMAKMAQGWALSEQGRAEREAGTLQIRQGLADWQATGAKLGHSAFLAPLVEQYLKLGQIKEGLSTVAEGLETVDRHGEHWWEPELHRLQGELLLQQGDEGKAEASFNKAIEVARQQQAKSLELRAAMSLSRLWQKQGQREKARQMLAKIYGWFTEGFDTPDLKEAKALLAELS
jgi:predicted ATPase